MLHQCGHRQCSCASAVPTPSFSIFFPMSGSKSSSRGAADDDGEVLHESSKSDEFNSSSAAAVTTVVDCTLSLGTPSTRLVGEKKSFAASSSSFRWDAIPKKHASPAAAGGGDDQFLLARRCANCNTTSTPLWRNGPRGPKSLCNACGIRYKKEERRAAAAATAPSTSLCLPSSSSAATEQALGYGYYRQTPQQYSPWGGNCYAPTSTASVEDVDGDLPYHSWRLKLVPPPAKFSAVRPGLFQYN
ncbi:GATA transcription factor 19-like [Zingiber officinale]|uniref:GATA-type domain-containing protein n=1 Tax=Zingiber officinale TaxID=94328 RepID=A0A8J5IAB8_ZINOF|nr:GATA transcription factor 19-like [Zingiber officinale]KAG6536650.1 hypothetical protein ZIOFF_001708 [Zingiber officinale]